MSRRADPERIETARRAAIRNRLIGAGELPERADAWIAAWASVAARGGLQPGAGYWERGLEMDRWTAATRRAA